MKTYRHGWEDEITVVCDDPDLIVATINAVLPELPRTVRASLNRIKLHLLQNFGKGGLYDRCNNRTVQAIIREFDGEVLGQPVESGELNGVRFELHDKREDRGESG